MTSWWRQRSFKLRLTLWYAVVTATVLASFSLVAYEIVEHRLRAEIDRQLRIDFDLLEPQLEREPGGEVRWLVRGAHGDEGFARLSAWFEVWSEDGQLLLRHWPVRESDIHTSLPAPRKPGLSFHETQLEQGYHVRVMERPARLQDAGVVVRVIRDESDMRRTLGEIVEVFLLALPFAVIAASLGGYLIAHRSLRPVAAMADEAQRITSESLSARLPNPNPADEFGQLASVFNDTLRRLESSFAELKRFTGDASHELRTPLTALRTVGEVALRGNPPAASRETISSMLEEAERLDELIESLLLLARLEGTESVATKESIGADDLVREVTESLGVLATEKQQTIVVEGTAGISLAADRVLVRHALLNVVHNAIRYAPAQTTIRIRATSEPGNAISIAVTDQGPGIPAEHHARVFERFFRIDKARSRAEGGYGLGLAIAKWSIERQGGRIELESAIGRGSTFRIVLPSVV